MRGNNAAWPNGFRPGLHLVALAAAPLALLGCSPGEKAQNPETKAQVAEAQALTPEQIEAKASEISQNDYRMFRSLMAIGGLDAELGGAAQGDAALTGLMMQFRQKLLGTRADLPRLVKISGPDEASGLAGLGASFFVGLLTTSALVTASGQSGEKSGTVGGNNSDGGFTGSFDQQKVSSESSFTGEISGLQGKVTTKVTLDICPKADGAITIDLLSDSSLTKIGGTAGANVKVTGKLTWFVNDDADFGSDINSDIRVENASFGGARGANGGYVDYTEKSSSVEASGNSGVLNRSSSKATPDDVATAQAAVKFARLTLMATAYKARDAFQSGQCVKLEPTSAPTKRSGVKPGTAFKLDAAPRSKIDGGPVGGTVKAELSGGATLAPTGTKVPADAKFDYTAPAEKKKQGKVSFEARSKRGMATAALDFDTNDAVAFTAVGGADAYKGSGTICDFNAPFEISGSGVTNKFVPTGPTTGTYSYKGNMSGIVVYGHGTYTATYDESGGSMKASGPGTVVTPLGKRTRNGTELYKLTPTTCP